MANVAIGPRLSYGAIWYICHMHRTTILLPEDLHRAAEDEARRIGLSLGELIRQRLRPVLDARTEAKPAFFCGRRGRGTARPIFPPSTTNISTVLEKALYRYGSLSG